ncbi:G-protein coupled receptor dmsr-1-like [Tubulanus polymorphus]|uniref:G-protein coupled receptor dmsr-1-like n=1 Tax=Tubulanus polymorphus TaxID=672921 RepID=UPI003DA4640E
MSTTQLIPSTEEPIPEPSSSDVCQTVFRPRDLSGLEEFHCWYAGVHGYASLIVCTFGVLTNILNIVILTRKNMQTSTNCILTGLAISDLLTMSSYWMFAYHFYVAYGIQPSPIRNTRGWVSFMMFNALFTATTHTISIWLGVLLAIFRYIYIRLSMEGTIMCSIPRAKVAVIIVYVCSVLVQIPNYCSLTVKELPDSNSNGSIFKLKSVNSTGAPFNLMSMNLWTYAILAKMIPCVLMTIFGGILVYTLHIAKRKSSLLHKSNRASDSFRNRMREHARTTRMLVAVIILFLVTELPQGILLLLSMTLDIRFFRRVYSPLGDFMDIIALINNSINFLLYCTMSKTFRENIIDVFSCFFKKHRKHFFLFKRASGESIL